MSTLRTAAVQAEARPGDVEANVAAAARLVAAAADDGARLAVFPEAFTTGYEPDLFAGPLPGLGDATWLAPLQRVVDARGTVVVLNTPLEHDGRRSLTDVVLAPGAAPWAAYAKQHLFPPEREAFVAGTGGAGVVIDGVHVALSVCYDAEFPAHATAAAAAGAHLYVNSCANFSGAERAHRRSVRHAARALDNGMYAAFVGLVGGSLGLVGGTDVYDPLGRLVGRLGSEPGTVLCDVDTDVVDRARAAETMLADRLDDLGGRDLRHVG
jgi:predicted amidohydrolase